MDIRKDFDQRGLLSTVPESIPMVDVREGVKRRLRV